MSSLLQIQCLHIVCTCRFCLHDELSSWQRFFTFCDRFWTSSTFSFTNIFILHMSIALYEFSFWYFLDREQMIISSFLFSLSRCYSKSISYFKFHLCFCFIYYGEKPYVYYGTNTCFNNNNNNNNNNKEYLNFTGTKGRVYQIPRLHQELKEEFIRIHRFRRNWNKIC